MRVLTILVILLYATNCMAQKTTSTPAVDELLVSSIELGSDTPSQSNLNWLFKLPSSLTAISCDFILSSNGEIFKASWSPNSRSKWATIQALIDRAKPKDQLIFTNIYVLKEGKRMRLPDKTIELK